MDELNRKMMEFAGLDIMTSLHPDFTHDPTVCFRYLVPEVLEEYNIESYSFKQQSGQYYSETSIWKKGSTKHGFDILHDERIAAHFEQGKDLNKITALALCRAIEKLMDGGGR